ncbi:hypothetical protein AHF37_09500, partial [Paragonimus kellicotti]
CKLLERQVIAIYGPITPNAVQSVQSLTNQFGIPHLQNDWGYHQTTQGFALNVHPHYLAFGQALYDYVRKAANWASVAVVYQDEQKASFTKLFVVHLKQNIVPASPLIAAYRRLQCRGLLAPINWPLARLIISLLT